MKSATKFKPNDFVVVRHPSEWVEGGQFNVTGQVVSYPFPEEKGEVEAVMVRMVVGDAGTMERVPIDRLFQPYGKPKWVQYARVWGGSSFPMDMLRYDHAYPVNFYAEQEYFRGTRMGMCIRMKEGYDSDNDLIIGRTADYKNAPWTEGRWNSFAWGIEHVNSIKVDSSLNV